MHTFTCSSTARNSNAAPAGFASGNCKTDFGRTRRPSRSSWHTSLRRASQDTHRRLCIATSRAPSRPPRSAAPARPTCFCNSAAHVDKQNTPDLHPNDVGSATRKALTQLESCTLSQNTRVGVATVQSSKWTKRSGHTSTWRLRAECEY